MKAEDLGPGSGCSLAAAGSCTNGTGCTEEESIGPFLGGSAGSINL